MDHIYGIDEDLVNAYVQRLAMSTLQQASQPGAAVSWQDVELAVHLIYLYGELQKSVKGTLMFVHWRGCLWYLMHECSSFLRSFLIY